MSTEPLSHRIFDSADLPSFFFPPAHSAAKILEKDRHEVAVSGEFLEGKEEELEMSSWLRRYLAKPADEGCDSDWKEVSPWSRSAAKRLFDFACVLLSLPVLVPVMLAIGAAVRFTSPGPVFFLQERVGRHGRTFTILKFRTMVHVADAAHHPITTADNQTFTPVGPFLRRWKLDELPQVVNVLLGQMSLVGPRPKLREHVVLDPPCRPGITGLATIIFAREEKILACVARERLDEYFHSFVLPAKRALDSAYMARATFFSDLRLLINSVLRRWDTDALDEFIVSTAFVSREELASPRAANPARHILRSPIASTVNRQEQAEEVSAAD